MSEIMYNCEICGGSYTTKKHYIKHLHTKKHNKMNSLLVECNFCKKVFSTKTNYTRHLKKFHAIEQITDNFVPAMDNDNDSDSIKDKKDKYDKELDLLKVVYELKHKNAILEKDNVILRLEKDNQVQKEKYEKELYKQKSEILEKNGETLEKDKMFAQDIAKSTIKTTDTAVKGLTYARKYYPNAPELKKMDKYDLGDDNELIDLLLFYSRKGTLSHYIGDFVIKFYKKNDPNDQSLWTTDIARLTFIVKQLLKNKTDWRYDKKGIKVCNIIVNPLLINIKTILKKYNNDINDMISGKTSGYFSEDEDGYESEGDYKRHKKNHRELDNNDKLKLVNNQKTATQIITEIDNKILAKDILKYISPHLSLSLCNE